MLKIQYSSGSSYMLNSKTKAISRLRPVSKKPNPKVRRLLGLLSCLDLLRDFSYLEEFGDNHILI